MRSSIAVPLLVIPLVALAQPATTPTSLGGDVLCRPDPQGQSLFAQTARRSPTGLRFRVPCRLPTTEAESEKGWSWSVAAEAGVLISSGDDEESLYREYRDWDDGLVVSAFQISGQDAQGQNFVELRGRSPWREDGSVALSYEQANSIRLQAGYERIPHRYADGLRSIFEGIGTDDLQLPADLSPGANSIDAIAGAVDDAPVISSGLERERYHLDLSYRPMKQWRITARYQRDEREGTRPISGGNSYSFIDAGVGSSVELLEPVDYTTNELELGVEWNNQDWALRAAWYASYFENDNDTLTWENPFTNGGFAPFPGGSPVIARGRLDLAPDNDFNQFRFDARRSLPWRGSLSGSLHHGRMRQNDALIPQTIATGIGGSPLQPIDLSQWNTIDGLSRQRAGARIDTLLGLVNIKLRPLDALSLRGRVRWYREDNDTDYVSFNPLTGQYGYISEDGAHAAVFPFESGLFEPGLPGSEWHIRNIPFDRDELNLGVGADWRLARKTQLNIDLKREEIDRRFRQVATTEENRMRLALNHRGFEKWTIRASAEYADREGGEYDSFPYQAFWSDSLDGFVPAFDEGRTAYALTSLRMFDLADREQRVLALRAHYLMGPRSDLSFSARHEDNEFNARHGLRHSDQISANLEFSFLPSHEQRLHAWLSYQDGDSNMAAIRDVGHVGANGDPGGPVFPLSNEWRAFFNESSIGAGAGLERPIGPLLWQLDLSWIDSRSAIAYDYASGSALATPLVGDAAGERFPDIRLTRRIAQTSVTWPFKTQWALRLFYRYEQGHISDWHYDNNPILSGRALYLGVDPDDYDAHAFGLLLQYRGQLVH